jgi:hypothetical protein
MSIVEYANGKIWTGAPDLFTGEIKQKDDISEHAHWKPKNKEFKNPLFGEWFFNIYTGQVKDFMATLIRVFEHAGQILAKDRRENYFEGCKEKGNFGLD